MPIDLQTSTPPTFAGLRGLSLDAWATAARARIDGRPVVVSVSGGKDSAAVCILLTAAKIPFVGLHLATGWEDDDHGDGDRGTEWYVREYLPATIGFTLDVRGYPGGMEALVAAKGMFPSRTIRYCTQELKTEIVKTYLGELIAGGHDPINAVGIRHEEGTTGNDRGTAQEWEHSTYYDCDVWRPIVTWTLDDVIQAHTLAGVRPNPLYLRGAERVGCYPCIFATKRELRDIADSSPARIDRMRRMEAGVGEQARAREWARTEAALAVLAAGGTEEGARTAALAAGAGHPAARSTIDRMIARITDYLAGDTADPMDGWNAPTWFQARISTQTATDEYRCNGPRCKARFTPPMGELDEDEQDEDADRPDPTAQADVEAQGWDQATTHVEGCPRPGYRQHVRRSGEPWPIDKVIAWSRTSHGGRQVELFAAPPGEAGCARWGLCEAPTKGGK